MLSVELFGNWGPGGPSLLLTTVLWFVLCPLVLSEAWTSLPRTQILILPAKGQQNTSVLKMMFITTWPGSCFQPEGQINLCHLPICVKSVLLFLMGPLPQDPLCSWLGGSTLGSVCREEPARVPVMLPPHAGTAVLPCVGLHGSAALLTRGITNQEWWKQLLKGKQRAHAQAAARAGPVQLHFHHSANMPCWALIPKYPLPATAATTCTPPAWHTSPFAF